MLGLSSRGAGAQRLRAGLQGQRVPDEERHRRPEGQRARLLADLRLAVEELRVRCPAGRRADGAACRADEGRCAGLRGNGLRQRQGLVPLPSERLRGWVHLHRCRLDPVQPGVRHRLGQHQGRVQRIRFAVLYAYAVPGTVSRFTMLFPQPGIEVMGHDLGSRNRYSINVFTAGGAPAARCTFCSPGVFGRVTHRQEFANGFLRSVRAGIFGAYVTWPVGPDSSDLKGQRRLGGDLEFGLGSDVLPLRVTVMGMTGRDDRALVPTATQNPTFNAGMLQLDYVPKLPLVFYGRLQVIRNRRQAIAGNPGDFGDQDFQLVGVRRALELTSRFAWVVELTYWRQKIKAVAPGGADATLNSLWLGSHLLF